MYFYPVVFQKGYKVAYSDGRGKAGTVDENVFS